MPMEYFLLMGPYLPLSPSRQKCHSSEAMLPPENQGEALASLSQRGGKGESRSVNLHTKGGGIMQTRGQSVSSISLFPPSQTLVGKEKG